MAAQVVAWHSSYTGMWSFPGSDETLSCIILYDKNTHKVHPRIGREGPEGE